MRNKFEMQLEELNNSLIMMGAMCESAIAGALKALQTGDRQLAKTVMSSDGDIDRKEKEIESLCFRLLLQQQPVAGDLRLISAALKMITDIERIADQAADIAEIITFADLSENISNGHMAQMAQAAITMVNESVDAYVKGDLTLARKVISDDDTVDGLFSAIKNDIIKQIAADDSSGEQAVDVLMIAKYLERIGDHATNIAEWVEFSITGTHCADER